MMETKKATKVVSAVLALTLIFSAASGLFLFAAAQRTPYPVWGYVTSGGNGVDSVEVNITDVTAGASVYATTNATGLYAREIYDAINSSADDDIFTCSATYGVETGSCSFVLNRTTNRSQRCDIRLVSLETIADLNVTAITPNCGYLFANETNTISAAIKNNGTAATGVFSVSFVLSDGYSEEVEVSALAAGVSTTLTITDSTIRTVGDSVTITVTADCGGAITESDETNNASSIAETVVNNGYKGKTYTGGANMTTWKTFDLSGNLLYSAGDSYYLSSYSNSDWTTYNTSWTANDLPVPGTATVREARLYVPYTWDKKGVMQSYVTMSFNGVTQTLDAHYSDEKMYATSYPYGMLAYNVTAAFSTSGNVANLTNSYPGGNNVSMRGMILVVIYADSSEQPRTIFVNEEFDLLYGGSSKCTTPAEATAYAPFSGPTIDTSAVENAKLVTFAPGADGSGTTGEGELIFNGQVWNDEWTDNEVHQIGISDRDVTTYLASTDNVVGFQSNADWMEASNAFLVVTYANGIITGTVTDSATGAGISGVTINAASTSATQTGVTGDSGNYGFFVIPGTYTVYASKSGYVCASAPVTVTSGDTKTVDFELVKDYVEIGLKAGEKSPKKGNVSKEIPFNLTVKNYGRASTYTITNPSILNATVTITPANTGEMEVYPATNGSTNILVKINASRVGTYPVTITASNTTYGKSASTTIVANALDPGVKHVENSIVSGDSTQANGSAVVDSNVTEGSNIGAGTVVDSSNVSNATTSGDTTISGSAVSGTTVADSSISEGSTITDAEEISNAVLTNATTIGGSVVGSTVTNATTTNTDITASSTVEDSVATDTTITGSIVSEASTVTGGTVTSSTVKDTIATGTTLVSSVVEHSTTTDTAVTSSNLTKVTATNCSITGVTLTNVVLEKATVSKNVITGKAEIAGETEAKVNISGKGGVEVHFENVYETVAVEDLIKNQTIPQIVQAGASVDTPPADAKEVGASLSLKSNVSGSVTISKCGINPGGSTFALQGFSGDITGDYLHIDSTIPKGTSMSVTIEINYGTSEPSDDKKIVWYNEDTGAWESKVTTKVQKADGKWYLSTTLDHLSIFAIATTTAVTAAPAAAPGGGVPVAPAINVPINPETGAITSTTTLTVAKATLTIPEGIIVKDAEGNPLATSITTLHTPSTAKTVGAITAYDFGPSGTTFSKPIDLVIAYDPAEIPAGFSEKDLVVKMYDSTRWIDIDTTVDTVAHTATAKVSHFTIFALFAFAEEEVIVETPTPPTPTETPTPTPTPEPEEIKRPWGLIIGIIIAVIVVGATAYYFYTKKKV